MYHLNPHFILNLAFSILSSFLAFKQAHIAFILKQFPLGLMITSTTTISYPLYTLNLKLLVLTVYFESSFHWYLAWSLPRLWVIRTLWLPNPESTLQSSLHIALCSTSCHPPHLPLTTLSSSCPTRMTVALHTAARRRAEHPSPPACGPAVQLSTYCLLQCAAPVLPLRPGGAAPGFRPSFPLQTPSRYPSHSVASPF